jgi:hypothetical protein
MQITAKQLSGCLSFHGCLPSIIIWQVCPPWQAGKSILFHGSSNKNKLEIRWAAFLLMKARVKCFQAVIWVQGHWSFDVEVMDCNMQNALSFGELVFALQVSQTYEQIFAHNGSEVESRLLDEHTDRVTFTIAVCQQNHPFTNL